MAVVLTTLGKGWLTDALNAALVAADYIGWGTGAGTAAVGDTALSTEASESRVLAARSKPAADTLRWAGQIIAAADKTITNIGNLTASVGGLLVIHGNVSVAVVAGEICDLTVDLQVA